MTPSISGHLQKGHKKSKAMTHVLVVEDEPAIGELLAVNIASHLGYQASVAASAEEAMQSLKANPPHLVLIDWMLPGASGLELARELRRQEGTRRIPIIFVTARTEEQEKLKAFEAGADDYITKPFSPRELIARIQAVLRRYFPESGRECLEAEGLFLDPAARRVSADGLEVILGPTEFALLSFFMANPEQVHSREKLLNRIWGINALVEERTVDVHIRRLRRALETTRHDRLLQTVRGIGYRFSSKGG